MTPALSLQFPIRHQIAKDYCRVVAAIDDEIFDGGEQRQLSTLFSQLQQSCIERGVLCHLHPYPKMSGGPDTDVIVDNVPAKEHHRRAVQVAEAANVIILDWNLGDNSASHAQSILRTLAKSDPVRFVLIYTSEEADVVKARLQKDFPELQQLGEIPVPILDSGEESEEEEGSEEQEEGEEKVIVETRDAVDTREENRKNEIPKGFHLNNRLFIFIGTKDHLNAGDVISRVQEALTCCFSDHLKWAGLEMAVKTRELLPSIVAALPDNTDNALLLQLLYQDDDEVAEQVGDVLVDELKVALRAAKLRTVCDETLVEHLRRFMAEIGGTNQEETFGRISSGLGSDYAELRQQARLKSGSTNLSKKENRLVNFDSRWRNASLKEVREKVKMAEVGSWFPHKKRDDVAPRQQALDLCEAIGCYLGECAKSEAPMLEPSISWSMVRESVLLTPTHPVMQPGAILQRVSPDTQDAEWVLCLTGACDCYRNKHGFLVVAGKERLRTDPVASGLRDTQSVFQKKEIVWDSSRLIVILKEQLDAATAVVPDNSGFSRSSALAKSDSIEDIATEDVSAQSRYQVVGCLRQEIAARLIHRVWTYQTRVGVDGAEMLRQRRAE